MNTIALPIPLIARGIYNLLGFFFFLGGGNRLQGTSISRVQLSRMQQSEFAGNNNL